MSRNFSIPIDYVWTDINRSEAEKLLKINGQFLCRYSSDMVGNNEDSGLNGLKKNRELVLSCRSQSKHFHFIIHKTKTVPVRYFFERHQSESIERLIDYHILNNVPITILSGVLIKEPIKVFKRKNLALLDHTSFPSDYLHRLYCQQSAIVLEVLNENPKTMPFINDILINSNSNVLAKSILSNDLNFFGFNNDSITSCDDDDGNQSIWFIRSGLQLILMPIGTQIRKDSIVRHECLKYFVIKTILKEKTIERKCSLWGKWIDVARVLEQELGNHLSFGSVMSGLCSPILLESSYWKFFSEISPKSLNIFEKDLRHRFNVYLNGFGDPNDDYAAVDVINRDSTLPFMIRLCHLIECSFIFDSTLLPMFDDNLEVN